MMAQYSDDNDDDPSHSVYRGRTTSLYPRPFPRQTTANPRKLEHGFRRIRARIPYTLP